MTKAVVLGWMSELERWSKTRKSSRKTPCYWKKLEREAGWDWADLGNLTDTKDGKKWMKLVKARMQHLDLWEGSQGKKWTRERPLRNAEAKRHKKWECAV